MSSECKSRRRRKPRKPLAERINPSKLSPQTQTLAQIVAAKEAQAPPSPPGTHSHAWPPQRGPPSEVPDQLVPDPTVAKEFHVTLMTLWRWDHDPRMAAVGWESPIKILNRNYRSRGMLERFKVTLRDVGIAAVGQSPRPTGARRPAPAQTSEGV
jgi:hypothetical protein